MRSVICGARRVGGLLIILAAALLVAGSSAAAPVPRLLVLQWSGSGWAKNECPHPAEHGDGCIGGYQVTSWTSIYYQELPGVAIPTIAGNYKASGEWKSTGEEQYDPKVHPNCRHTIHYTNAAGQWYAGAAADNGRLIVQPYVLATPVTGCGEAQVNMGPNDTTTDLGPIKPWADDPHKSETRIIHRVYKGDAHSCGNPNISSCQAEFTGKLTVTEYTGPPPKTPPPLPPTKQLPPLKTPPPTVSTTTTSTSPSAGSCARITSVSFTGGAANPSVVVHGTCLGTRPAPNPSRHPAGLGGCPAMSGDDGYLYGTNLYLAVPAQGWAGGRYRPELNEIDCLDLVITKFSPTEVAFHFGPSYRSFYPKFSLTTGTQVTIAVNGALGDFAVSYH
jgi:hypothetical protein